MKILLTCEDYFPVIGGAEICVHALKNEYERLGHTVTVFTNTMQIMPDEKGAIVRIPWKFSPLSLWGVIRTLWRLIGTHDIVHSQYSFRLACITSVCAWLRTKPMILTQQGKGIVPEVHPYWHHAFLASCCRRISLRFATAITSTSGEITILTAAIVPTKEIHSITNGFDARIFQPNPSLPLPSEYAALPANTGILLTVRRLVPKNGIHILIQALTFLREIHPHFHYFAIGEGRARPVIEALIEKHQLQSQVTLLGSRENHTLPSYYQHASIVLIPSSAEATSIACIEAMGMKKVIVASRVGGLIDLLGTDERFGTLVDLYDTEACSYDAPDTLSPEKLSLLAETLHSALYSPEVPLAKAAAAYDYAKEHCSWESIALQYLHLYRRFLSSSS